MVHTINMRTERVNSVMYLCSMFITMESTMEQYHNIPVVPSEGGGGVAWWSRGGGVVAGRSG